MVGLGSELTTNLSGVQPIGSPDIVLVGFEPESESDYTKPIVWADSASDDCSDERD